VREVPKPTCQTSQFLLDHLVGECEQLGRYIEAERLCHRKIDNQLEFCRLHHRQVCRLFPSNPIFQFDYTLMVPAGSSIAKVADADRAGVRIAAVRNHASTNELVRQVKQAEFVYAETPEQTFALMRDGKADVMASTRLVLLDFSAKLAGARVLSDRYGAKSTEWSCRKVRSIGSLTSMNSSRRPKPQAPCSSSSSAAAPAGLR
jgi:hypothetical protein